MCKERRLKVVSIRDLTLNELFDVVQANKFRMKVSVKGFFYFISGYLVRYSTLHFEERYL